MPNTNQAYSYDVNGNRTSITYGTHTRNRHLSAKVRVFVEWVAELIPARTREMEAAAHM